MKEWNKRALHKNTLIHICIFNTNNIVYTADVCASDNRVRVISGARGQGSHMHIHRQWASSRTAIRSNNSSNSAAGAVAAISCNIQHRHQHQHQHLVVQRRRCCWRARVHRVSLVVCLALHHTRLQQHSTVTTHRVPWLNHPSVTRLHSAICCLPPCRPSEWLGATQIGLNCSCRNRDYATITHQSFRSAQPDHNSCIH